MKKITALLILSCILIFGISCDEKDYENYPIDEDFFEPNNSNKQTEKQTEKQTKPPRIIHFETNGGNYIDSIDLYDYEGEMPTPIKDGYGFIGWYLDPALTQEVTYPYRPNGIVTVYAKWIKTKHQAQCEDFSLKLGIDMDSSKTFSITPNGFDIENLRKYGYKMKITVTYDFYYRKDYNVPLNIGYAGPPKYEIFIMNNDLMGVSKKDLKTYESKETRSLEYITSAADLDNHSIYLTFSTNNIQNIIYFNNITVSYECFK